MAAVTTSLDLTYTRVGVSLSGWSADGVVTVNRVHPDGSRNPVRGMSAVSGGVAFGWDYEAPLSVPVSYEAWDGSTLAASAAATLPAPSRAVLTVPGLPSFGGSVLIAERPQPKRPRPTAALNVIGRETPIVKSDVLKAPSFTLSVLTQGDVDAYTFLSTLEVAPVLLLRIPGTRVTDWCYISTGDVDEVPVSRVLPPSIPVTDGLLETWAAWTVACQVVEAPAGGVFGDPTATYQASLDAHPTYADRLTADATYIDALRS